MTIASNPLPQRAFTEKQAAEYIGMSRSFLAKSRMTGRRKNYTHAPNFIKIGRNVRYLREDLEHWVDSKQRLEHSGQQH